MDKFEYKVKADEIKDLIATKEYAEAAEIADEIDWRRVKSVMMLCTISDLYKVNRRYEDAKNLLLLAYERRPGGRTICYSLCELYIKLGDFVHAVKYYNEFKQAAPNDSGCYILQYKLLEAQEASLEERIEVLEELKSRDYREKWAYELAYLYHRIGLATCCVEECDRLILWFGSGKYVVKAMELKMLHQPLDAQQQEKYDRRFEGMKKPVQTEEISARGQEPGASQENVLPEYTTEQQVDLSATGSVWAIGVAEKETVERELPIGVKAVVTPEKAEEMDIQVKTVDVGQCNTINLQAELAAGLQEFWQSQQKQQTEEEHTTDADTGALDYPETDENDLESEVIEGTEVFFGETGEIGQIQQNAKKGDTADLTELRLSEHIVGEVQADNTLTLQATSTVAVEETAETVDGGVMQENGSKGETEDSAGGDAAAGQVGTEQDDTRRKVMEQMRLESLGIREEQALTAQPPKELAKVLTQEPDGQIRIVVPEREQVEKQITGQMNLQDILAEWERIKKENEEKHKKEVRKIIEKNTGTMLNEFEAQLRDTLLEQMESGLVSGTSDIDKMVREAEQAASGEVAAEQSGITEDDEVEELEEISAKDDSEEDSTYDASAEEKVSDEDETAEADAAEKTSEEDETVEGTSEEAVSEEEETTEEASAENTSEEDGSVEAASGEQTSEEETAEGDSAEADSKKMLQEAPKVRSLTREEREMYGPFIQTRSAKEMLVKAIDAISLAAYTGNLIITGEEGMDTMVLAKRMIREVQMTDSNFSGKVAKISGINLNKQNVEELVRGLNNGALIIKKASDMSVETSENLHKALQQESFGIIVVLEDTKKGITKLLLNKPKLLECFTARVDLQAMSNDTLASFGRQYARELEYSIDELGMLALHTRIEELQTSSRVVTVMDVKAIVDEAIHRANKKTMRHFVDILVAKRYDDEDMIILTERHFD